MSVSPDIHSAPNIKSQITPTVDSEREEFRKYLESSGLLDVLNRILKELYEKEERPVDPLNYFSNALITVNYYAREIAALENEINELKEIISNLEKENAYLRDKLNKESSA